MLLHRVMIERFILTVKTANDPTQGKEFEEVKTMSPEHCHAAVIKVSRCLLNF